MVSKSITVKGKVQGVFYRASTLTETQQLGVTGFVKNMPNGDVYIEVHGEDTQVRALIEWCKEGPRFARVDDVLVDEIPYKEYADFSVAY